MNVNELLAQLIFSSTGKEVRAYYTLAGLQNVIEYVGITNAINAATSAKVWFITKIEYDGNACFVRSRTLSTQQVLDDRATLFP